MYTTLITLSHSWLGFMRIPAKCCPKTKCYLKLLPTRTRTPSFRGTTPHYIFPALFAADECGINIYPPSLTPSAHINRKNTFKSGRRAIHKVDNFWASTQMSFWIFRVGQYCLRCLWRQCVHTECAKRKECACTFYMRVKNILCICFYSILPYS